MLTGRGIRGGREWVAALLVLCGLAAFAVNVNAFFVSDDFVLLSWTRVHSLGDVAAFFDPHVQWFYRPVVKLVYWAGQGLFGLHAAPFHVLSLLLHGANTYLVYRLVLRSSTWGAGVAAALIFLLEPHHAETVSWISAVGDLLGTLCILANLLLFSRFLERGSYVALAGALALFVVGLLARETVVLLPALLLLYVLIVGVRRKVSWEQVAGSGGAYVVLLGAYLLVVRSGGVARGGLGFHPLNLDSILLGLLDYAHRLAPGGEWLASAPLDVLKVLVWVEWAAILAAGVVLWRLRWRSMLLGLAWLLLTPLAFIFFSAPTDRYFYLPSVGYAILLGAMLGNLPKLTEMLRLPSLRLPTTVAATVAVLALLTWRGVALEGKVLAWRAAGQSSGGVLHDLRQAAPDPNDYTAFYLVDVPVFRGGIPVFQNGLQEAVQETYDNTTIAAHATDCATLQKQAELPRYSLFFRCKVDGAEQLPSVAACR